MLFSKSKISQIIFLTSITVTCNMAFFGNSLPTHAKPSENQKNSYEGLPSNRRDGGSRGACVANGKDFIALVPKRPVNVTTSVASQILFYVPQTQEPKTIEFILRTRDDQLVHETFVQTQGQAGIMSVAIPDQVKENSRESYGDYHWYLSMICDPNQRSKDIVLEGWIEHVELNSSMEEKIALSSSIEKFNLLQQEGVWYDALAVLAQSHQSDSNVMAVKTEWLQILESIGLGELASEPLIEAEIVNDFYSTPLTEY